EATVDIRDALKAAPPEIAYTALATAVGGVLASLGDEMVRDGYPPQRDGWEDDDADPRVTEAWRLADEMEARFYRLVEGWAAEHAENCERLLRNGERVRR